MSFMSMEELREMTRATHVKKVCRVLVQMGIAYKLDGEGNPVVRRSAVEAAFGGDESADSQVNIAERLQRLKEIGDGKKANQRRRTS